ncbi:TPA: alanine--glyoxylate aminotransferase family protein [Staphylococcus aureus]
MYYHQPLLLTPGPTPVPDAIMREIQAPMVGHRSKDFEDIAQQAFQGLKPIFGSQNDVLILTSSGTSVLEASMLNIVNPEDHFVVIVSGAFGNRFKQIAQTYYKNVHIYDVTWGEAVDVKDFINYLSTLDVEVKAVFSQYCETSTTVLHPIHELGNAINQFNSNIYFVVDGVSCIGAVDVDINKDKIDVLVSGSQKAIMLPPGLAFVAYSHRAKERFKEVTTPKFYLDLNKYISSQADNSTPFTPNVSLFRGVNALRSALKALDLTLLVNDKDASPTVTAFKPNTNDEVKIIKDELKNRFKITIAGGQGHLKGQILRIGHMGKISPFDILSVVSALEIILTEHRKVNYIGKGISKYMEVIHEAI